MLCSNRRTSLPAKISDRVNDMRPSAMPCPVTAASISAFVSVKEVACDVAIKLQAGRPEPCAPREVAIDQQRLRQHRRGILRQTAVVEAGAAHRKAFFIEKLDGPQPLPIARSEPDCDVDAIRFEIGERLAGLDVQIDAGKPGRETRKARNQPAGCHHRQQAYGDVRLRPARPEAAECRIQFGEGAFDAGLQSQGARGWHHPVALPLEKREAQLFFQLPYPLADGAVRHVQFARCFGVAAVAASHLEHPQGFQRRQRCHSSIVRNANRPCQILSFDPRLVRE